jgi:hypothetical protein
MAAPRRCGTFLAQKGYVLALLLSPSTQPEALRPCGLPGMMITRLVGLARRRFGRLVGRDPPVVVVLVSTSRRAAHAPPSVNRRRPDPRTSGWIRSRRPGLEAGQRLLAWWAPLSPFARGDRLTPISLQHPFHPSAYSIRSRSASSGLRSVLRCGADAAPGRAARWHVPSPHACARCIVRRCLTSRATSGAGKSQAGLWREARYGP